MKFFPVAVLASVGLACAALAGCGPPAHGTPAAAPTAARAGAGPVAAAAPAPHAALSPTSLSGMVSAVSAADSDRPIDLKFELMSRPQVGKPLTIALALTVAPGTQLQALRATLAPSDGLQLQSANSFGIEMPTPGEVVRQQVTLLPQRAGVLRLDATVLFHRAGSSIARTFSIPLIVADDAS